MISSTIVLVAALILTPEEAEQKQRPLDSYVLTDEMVLQAIEEGREKKGGVMGLRLPRPFVLDWVQDKIRALPLTEDPPEGSKERSTGFSIAVYTPYSWVSQQASWAAKRYQTFSREDVTEDISAEVLRVFAYPDMPTVPPEINQATTSGVDNVIIRSTAKKNFEVLRPVAIEEGWEYAYTRAGAEVAYTSKSAVFDLEQVAKIAQLDEKGEFFVVVIGTKYNGNFKIKTRHFDELP